jgi:hypothetical protein
MEEVIWQYAPDQSGWVGTFLEDARIDVYTPTGTVSLSLLMFIELIYPLIEKRLNKAFSIELSPPRVVSIEINATAAFDPEKIAKAI